VASAHRPVVANDLAHDIAGLEIIGCDMAQYGEWSRKGATLSHVTARKEYGVDEDFIVTGIKAGKLEYREGAVHGNPYIRVLRRQLEAYMAKELGDEYLRIWQEKTERREITRNCRAAQTPGRAGGKKSADRRSGLTATQISAPPGHQR
jgi:hypothetical protein